VSIEDEIRALQQIPIFQDLEVSKLKLMAFAGQRISYRKDEMIFAQGAASDAVYIILEGEVDVIRLAGSNSVLLARLGKNELIGEMGVLCDKPRNAMIVAHTDVQALRIDKATFIHIVHQVPQLALAIIRELSGRLEQANDRLAAAQARAANSP
jgi:CRP/FNR family cyclic AMP-dependent transcriptional regulator